MYNDIYSLVSGLIGELPPELNFVYGFAVIFIFILLALCVVLPFFIVYKVISGK